MGWGLTTEQVINDLREREWLRWNRLRSRLLGERPMPIKVPLHPPTGQQALQDLPRFQTFIASWQQWPDPDQIEWQTRHYQQIGTYHVPVSLTIPTRQSFFEVLGPDAIARSRLWETRLRQFNEVSPCLTPVVIKHLRKLETFSESEVAALVGLLPQLQKNTGEGLYLRALPVTGVDTKFIENNSTLISELLEAIYPEEQIKKRLAQWLGCIEKPKGWLIVRPLCPITREQMMGLSVLKLSSDTLKTTPLPASKILVVENEASGFGLPELPDTIAVIGGGKNTSWMGAKWLSSKGIGYWGDIDTWGLTFLSNARSKQPHLTSLMMNEEVFQLFCERASHEEVVTTLLPHHLNIEEVQLFYSLLKADKTKNRLEQERLSQDYINYHLLDWSNTSRAF